MKKLNYLTQISKKENSSFTGIYMVLQYIYSRIDELLQK